MSLPARLLRNTVFAVVHLLNELSFTIAKSIGSNYQLVFPYATFAPWVNDPEFERIFSQVKRNSLVNRYQCFELWKLVEQVADVKGDIIEVGVYRGATSAIIGTKKTSLNLPATLYCCDTFSGVVNASEKDNFYGI